MKLQFLTLFISLLGLGYISAQVGINTNSPDPSAALDIQSTTGGLLIPRLSEAQKNAITSPANGLMIYQTNQASGFYFYDGNNWKLLSSDSSQPSVDYNDQMRYTISGASDLSHMVDIVSTSTVFYNNNYTVTNNTVQVNHVSHGLSVGDFINVLGLSLTEKYHEITNVISDDIFEINSSDFTENSGSNFTYSHAVEIKDITYGLGISTIILSIPQQSDLIINSIRIYYSGVQDQPITITFPYNILDKSSLDLPLFIGRTADGNGYAGAFNPTPSFDLSQPNKLVVGQMPASSMVLKIIL